MKYQEALKVLDLDSDNTASKNGDLAAKMSWTHGHERTFRIAQSTVIARAVQVESATALRLMADDATRQNHK